MQATESQSIWCFISKWCSANVTVDITNFVLKTYSPLEFDYRKQFTNIWQKLMTWNKRDEFWKTMNSLFTRHSGMSLRASCQLISRLKKSLHQLKLLWKTKTWSNFDSAVEYKSLLSFSSATSMDIFLYCRHHHCHHFLLTLVWVIKLKFRPAVWCLQLLSLKLHFSYIWQILTPSQSITFSVGGTSAVQ